MKTNLNDKTNNVNSGKPINNNKNKKQPKKTKKGQKMYDSGLYGGVVNTGIVNSTLLTGEDVVNISLTESKKNRGYIFYLQKDLQEIFKKSGPNAIENEFQVHYWFLNFRFKAEDRSIIDIAIPTCYFNYEQFVTNGHVDFELKDVGPLSEKVMPLHNIKVNELLAFEIDKKINEAFDNKLTFEAMSVNFGTLHRHPGQSGHQNFSSTDLNINVTTEAHALGVVFPLADAEDDKPSFSAIIALDGSSFYNKSAANLVANLAHCEYRNANGKIQTGLNYEKNRCIAFNVMPLEQPSIVEKLFGEKPTRKSVTKYSNTENKLFQLEEKLLEIFEDLETKWEASTLAVFPENVKIKSYATAAKITYIGGVQQFPGLYDEDETSAYSDYFKNKANIKINTDSKEEASKTTTTGSGSSVKTTPKSPYDKYLYAKSELTKINQHATFIQIVKKYISIENEKNYLSSLDNTVEVLTDLLSDYNTMSSLYLGKGHREEEVSYYVNNNIVDFRDISDFLNENINMAMAIVEETHCNIQTLKDYEIADSNALRSNHLYANPFPSSDENVNKNETTTESTVEIITITPEPEDNGVVDTILGAVNKFKNVVLKG